MNRKSILSFCACLFLFCNIVFAQSSVNVNPLTGTGSVTIPIYTVSSGQVAVPVSLAYVATGVKPKDVESTAGMNWQLDLGGSQVSRLVRGLPDDCSKDNAANTMLGWMSAANYGAGYAKTFTIQNDGGVTCSKETTDIYNITNNIPFNNDTEPDLFYVSAPGLSCELVYSRDSSKFKPITYQDLLITYTTVGGSGDNASDIASFTITNDRGIKYVFSAPEWVTQSTSLGSGSAVYFNTKYQQYLHGVTYADAWNLTSITDPNGNSVVLSYSAAPPRDSTDPVVLYLNNGVSYSQALQYYVLQSVTPQTLNTIGTSNVNASKTWLTLTWSTLNGTGQTGQTVISSIAGMGRDFQFTYTPVVFTSTGYSRSFLRNFSDPGCSTPINYQFSYIGETNTGTPTVPSYTTIIPDSVSTQVDYWGYYSTTAATTTLIPSVYVNSHRALYQRYLIEVSASPGSIYDYTITNNNRGADITVAGVGALNKINYVQGGSTNIIYESNSYYDVPSNSTVTGGGIRVKQVIDSVASGSTNNIVRNYSYVNSSGVSNGKPVSLPQFAFTTPYSGSATGLSLWEQATALSAYDLSPEDHTIMYTSSKVSQTGAGSTVYNYIAPATYWDTFATPSCSGCSTDEWYPTLNYVARNNCSLTYGPVINNIYSYPFTPNPNYDFERGLPTSVVSFNDAGSEVSETDYTYQRSYTPTAITAFKNDENGVSGLSVLGYNKYTVFYNTSELPYTVTKKVFDSSNNGTSQSSTTTYTYGSTFHKLLSLQTATNSDGSTVNTHYQYIKDFAPNNGTNLNIKAMYNLESEHINAPVETYQQVTRGSTVVTTSASLTLFQGVAVGSGVTLYVPSQQLKIAQPDGAATFSQFTINTGAQTISPDGNYFPVANFDTFDNTGTPVTIDDAHKKIQTTIFDHLTNHPTAVFKNTYSFEVAFNDFDTQPASPTAGYGLIGFTLSGTGLYYPVGSHTGNALGMAYTQTATSGNLLRNAVAQNYIFSIWINAAAPGRLTLTLPGSTAADTIHYSGGWKYYELKRPKSTSAIYTVSFTTTQNISVDDILFYPDVAEASTAAYDPATNYKTAQTNTNGVSAYLTNDEWGRVLYAYDQDKNIVQRNTFITPADISSAKTAIILAGTVTSGVATTFSVSGPNTCAAAGITVTWKFGDGTTATAPGLTSPSHTYYGVGTTDTVRATLNSPLLGTIILPYIVITVQGVLIPISYTTYASSHGDISGITLTNQGSGPNYNLTPPQFNTAYILQGKYTVVVTLSDGQHYNSGTGVGYDSVNIAGSCGNWCDNWASSNTYTFSVDASSCTSLNFTVLLSICGI